MGSLFTDAIWIGPLAWAFLYVSDSQLRRGLVDFETVFGTLRAILQKYDTRYVVTHDAPARYCLEATPGPATLRAWGGKTKKPLIPIAWVEINKSYVSYHVMGLYPNSELSGRISQPLKVRMQGKTCFNFTRTDEALVTELERVTAEALAGFERAGFITEQSRL